MKIIKIFIAMTGIYFLLGGNSYCAQEEDFPKIGFVKNNGSNVRSGDNINFESLCRLEKGDPVKIIGKRYSWYKIILPKKAHLYVKNDYVDVPSGKGIGEVNALRVNLRAGPGTKYSILGQVSKPKELNVLLEGDGWYKIEPPEGTTGWIDSSQIKFTLEYVNNIEVKAEEKKKEETKEKSSAALQKKKNILNPVRANLPKGVRLTLEPPAPKGNLRISTESR